VIDDRSGVVAIDSWFAACDVIEGIANTALPERKPPDPVDVLKLLAGVVGKYLESPTETNLAILRGQHRAIVKMIEKHWTRRA